MTSISDPIHLPSESSPSRREKTAWICFVTTVAVYVPYFVYVGRQFGRREFGVGSFVGPLLCAVVVQIIATTVAAVLFLLRDKTEPKDERDLALEARSVRWAYYVLGATCFSLVMSMPGILLSPLATNVSHSFLPMLIAEALLLCFVAAEAIRYLTLALGYRRGA